MLWDGMRREGIGTDDLQFGSRGRMAYLEKAELRRDQLMSVSFFFSFNFVHTAPRIPTRKQELGQSVVMTGRIRDIFLVLNAIFT